MTDYHYDARNEMLYGSAEAEKHTYKKLVDKRGQTWLVAVQPNEGDNIYVSAGTAENRPGYRGFRGFGGQTLTFELESGEKIELQGPWHSNSTALYTATGYDVRDKHKTFGVVARKCEDGWLRDVIYQDGNWEIGVFNRVEMIAQQLANDCGHTLQVYSESQGGSSRGPVEPEHATDGPRERED